MATLTLDTVKRISDTLSRAPYNPGSIARKANWEHPTLKGYYQVSGTPVQLSRLNPAADQDSAYRTELRGVLTAYSAGNLPLPTCNLWGARDSMLREAGFIAGLLYLAAGGDPAAHPIMVAPVQPAPAPVKRKRGRPRKVIAGAPVQGGPVDPMVQATADASIAEIAAQDTGDLDGQDS
jgi:hypothetical protein